MRANSLPLRLAALMLALPLAACFGGGRAPSELLTLTPTNVREPGTVRRADQGEVITVLAPSVPQAVSTRRIPVYVSPTTIQYLTNATYIEEPADLFRALLSETVAARTGRAVLDPAQYSQVQGAVLSGQLIQFGLDPNRMEVVVLFDASITRNQVAAASNRFEARVPVTEAVAAQVAPALNQAANQVAEQVADWVGR